MKLSVRFVLLIMMAATMWLSCSNMSNIRAGFVDPASEFKPMPFWHINGTMSRDESIRQITDGFLQAGFSGVAVLPISSVNFETMPEYLTEPYFDQYRIILERAKSLKGHVIMYDDTGFPSGTAGGRLKDRYPNSTRKRLDKTEIDIVGPALSNMVLPVGKLMAAVAMNTVTLERVDITKSVVGNQLIWPVPEGVWKIMAFSSVQDVFHKRWLMVDMLDSAAVNNFISLTYDEYGARFSDYFGSTVKYTFFDDVGFFRAPRTWTDSFNEKFSELYGFSPTLYYPALWYDIGEQSQAARAALYNTRAELLAEGFPKQVAKWNDRNGLKSMGHPPGNYNPQPTDMNGDIFKFYRYTHVPLMDAIIDYGYGRDGHKLISSVADMYDRPVVGAEIYGAFKDSILDKDMLYRVAMEVVSRGANFIIPHGMWYTDKVNIPPLISTYNPKISEELPSYSNYVGRICYMLQGGRRVSEIALMYPIHSVQGWYIFDSEANNVRAGHWVSPQTDYLHISNILTNHIRRDFTFVHPEYFATEKYTINGAEIKLNNEHNFQNYKVLILSGCDIFSLKTLKKIKSYYDGGGCVIATSQLPFKSVEFDKNDSVKSMIESIFYASPMSFKVNSKGGKSVFVDNPTPESLATVMKRMNLSADVEFVDNPKISSDKGVLTYMHKIKNRKSIYFFANSGNDAIDTQILLRGKLNMEQWNPHNGEFSDADNITHTQIDGVVYTKYLLKLSPVSSIFLVEN